MSTAIIIDNSVSICVLLLPVVSLFLSLFAHIYTSSAGKILHCISSKVDILLWHQPRNETFFQMMEK